jgi:hypothetical protein
MKLPWFVLVLASFAASALARSAEAQAPSLSHSAPKLGRELTLGLDGAPPGASVRLYSSPGEVHSQTPYGLLELERGGLTLTASGLADPSGHFAHSELVPLDPALAETWRHYQALVQDPLAASGWVLSEAVHLRLVGPRLYETCSGLQWGDRRIPAELRVLSGMDLTTLAVIPLADEPLSSSSGQPVFTEDLARGAVVAGGDRLLIFDNFHFVPIAELPVNQANPELIPGTDGRSVVVLETDPARILWVDLAGVTVSDSLPLPNPVEHCWTASADGREAWLGESPAGERRLGLRRVDLAAHQVLEGVLIGIEWEGGISDLSSAPGLVFATSSHYQGYQAYILSLSTLDLSTSPPEVNVLQFPDWRAHLVQPVPEAAALVLTRLWAYGPGSERFDVSALTASPAFRALPSPPISAGRMNICSILPDGQSFWALDGWGYDDEWGNLLNWSFDAAQWRVLGLWGEGRPCAMELARDGLVQKAFVALDGTPDYYPNSLPSVEALDLTTQTWSRVRGGWGPASLRAITVP